MKIVKIKTTTVPRAFEIITDEEKLLIGFSTSDDGLRYKSILTIVKWMAQGKGKISAKELKMMIPLEGESYPKFYRQWRDYANSRRYGKNYPFTLSRSAGNNWKLIEDKKVKHDFATAFFHNQDKDFESALFWLGDYKITKVEFNPLLEDQAEKNEGTSQTASIKKPLQRPRPADYFLGREAQINKILPRLQPGSIITICAPGGIGKTALAAEILKRMISDNKPPERFEDGVVFYSFYGQPDTNKALEAIARAFGYEPKPNPADAAFNALSGKRVLLVLDGTEEADDLRKVLRVAGNCGILITSRNSRDAVVDREDLAPLEPDEALKLLYDWAEGKIDNENSAKSTCEIVGGLPLAVRLIGHYLRQTKDETVSSYLEWLEKTPLDALDPDEKRHRENSVPWLLQRSLKQVGEQAISVIALCGCLALAPFSRNLISEVLGFSLREVRLAFKQLTGYGFLLSINADRYEVSHALIHTYAHERLQVGSNVIERLIDKYIYLAEAETKKGLIGYHHLDTERLHIVYLLKVCIKRGAWDAAMRLAWAIEDYMDIQGYWIERLTVNETGWKSALQLKNRIKEGAWLNRLGLTYNDLGQMEKAIEYYQLALSINREIGDRRDEGIVLGNMGLAHRAIGQMEKAIEYHQQALSIDREIGDRKSEGIDLGNLGIVYRELGQIEKAIEYHQQALSIDREIGDRRGEGADLGNLGDAYRDLGQMEKAIEYHQQALSIDREIGDRRGEGIDLGNLGDAYRELGQMEKAVEYYQQALCIAHNIGDRRYEGEWLGNLGNVYSALDQVEKALGYYDKALAISQEIGDRRNGSAWLSGLGDIYRKLNQMEKAQEYCEKGLKLAREIGDRIGIANLSKKMGYIYDSLGQKEKAKQYLQESYSILVDLKSPGAESVRIFLESL